MENFLVTFSFLNQIFNILNICNILNSVFRFIANTVGPMRVLTVFGLEIYHEINVE